MTQAKPVEQDNYSAGFHVAENYAFKSQRGLNREIVEQISEMKGEPSWMRDIRLKSLEHFWKRPMPTWGADLSGIDFDRSPGKPYQVYLNLPEGQDPDPHSIYFAGVLGFFGLSAAQHDAEQGGDQKPGGVRLFDITDLVARQTAAGVWTGDRPTVTFVLGGVAEPGGTLKANPQANARIGTVEILRQ